MVAAPVLVTERSAVLPRVAGAVVELLFAGFGSVVKDETVVVLFAAVGSGVGDETAAVFETVPLSVPEVPTTNVNAAVAPEVIEARLHAMLGPVVHANVGPEFWTRETKVSPAGSTSVHETVL